MKDLQKIKNCLISVSDKNGIVELAKYLTENDIEIISTGGTYKLLKENNIKAKDISEFTGFPEIMDGRVKTLHPKVHGGLLAILDDKNHQKQAEENGIKAIDLLIINLYPFVETLARTNNEEEIIENIDIGGPAMVRSASKNFAYKTVITSPDDYKILQEQLEKNNNSTNLEFRKNMAARAFKNIADYDVAIADYFTKDENTKSGASNIFENPSLPKELNLQAPLKQTLRYGENAHQKAALYSTKNGGIVEAKQIQGKELSYNNFNDADAAYNLACDFTKPACVIVKHANPCGVAIGNDSLTAYQKAFEADSKSAFGGIVALNGKIDANLASEIAKIFFEVIIAKEIDEEARAILGAKKNLRVLIADFKKTTEMSIKSISGGILAQENDNKIITKKDLIQVSEKSIKDEELDELIFAMNVCKYVKSNAIVLSQNLQTVGLGVGQTNRVDACEIACKKAGDKASGAYLASDAFFPFADNIEVAASYKIKAIVAPKGSIKDEEVIAMANKKGLALYFIETRHFRH